MSLSNLRGGFAGTLERTFKNFSLLPRFARFSKESNVLTAETFSIKVNSINFSKEIFFKLAYFSVAYIAIFIASNIYQNIDNKADSLIS